MRNSLAYPDNPIIPSYRSELLLEKKDLPFTRYAVSTPEGVPTVMPQRIFNAKPEMGYSLPGDIEGSTLIHSERPPDERQQFSRMMQDIYNQRFNEWSRFHQQFLSSKGKVYKGSNKSLNGGGSSNSLNIFGAGSSLGNTGTQGPGCSGLNKGSFDINCLAK